MFGNLGCLKTAFPGGMNVTLEIFACVNVPLIFIFDFTPTIFNIVVVVRIAVISIILAVTIAVVAALLVTVTGMYLHCILWVWVHSYLLFVPRRAQDTKETSEPLEEFITSMQ